MNTIYPKLSIISGTNIAFKQAENSQVSNNEKINAKEQLVTSPIKDEFKLSAEKNNKLTKREKIILAVSSVAVAVPTAVLLVGSHFAKKYLELLGDKAPLGFIRRIINLGKVAATDEMTGLGNKANLLISLDKDYRKAIKDNKSLNIGMFDMDNFKSINEILNHTEGDSVLKLISGDIKAICEKHGVKPYRFGGEEFVITSIGKSKEEMKGIMEEISQTIAHNEELQSKLPNFMSELQTKLDSITQETNNVQINIFDQLKKAKLSEQEEEQLRKSIVEFVESRRSRSDNTIIDAIINRMEQKSGNQINIDTLIQTDKNTKENLGVLLDNLLAPLESEKHDLEKWYRHFKRTNKFTISGGCATFNNQKHAYDTSLKLLKVADDGLQRAKAQGKNNIFDVSDIIKLPQ